MKSRWVKIGWNGLIEAVGWIILALSLAALAGAKGWSFELLSHFKFHYCLILSIIVAYLIHQKCFKLGWIFGLGIAINLAALTPHYYFSLTPSTHPDSIRLMLINLNFQNRKYQSVLNAIDDQLPDIFLAQEVTQKWADELSVIHQYYPYRIQEVRGGSFGISLYSKIPFKGSITYMGDTHLPSIQGKFVLRNNREFHFIGTHPTPPTGPRLAHARNDQLNSIRQTILRSHELLTEPLLILGDLNITRWSPIFQKFINGTRLQSTEIGFGIQPTWPVSSPLVRIPIDHCLVSPEFLVHQRRIGPNVGSDHFPLIVDVSLKPRSNGKRHGNWKISQIHGVQ